ncbi:hypothetical protein CEXT_494101 [Caerostris extrusa]|uniref:Uncharacterized protein n=1 Tax=Caerostris extrusa TaxID=172846 RepID=A0AAV4VXI1_CAEEX|nr:hypothetical protein CEXT_494101 [Caerostris extrusa]
MKMFVSSERGCVSPSPCPAPSHSACITGGHQTDPGPEMELGKYSIRAKPCEGNHLVIWLDAFCECNSKIWFPTHIGLIISIVDFTQAESNDKN